MGSFSRFYCKLYVDRLLQSNLKVRAFLLEQSRYKFTLTFATNLPTS
jgi:hypothetical protein